MVAELLSLLSTACQISRREKRSILARMTDQGYLVWSRTGRMARITNPDQKYRIVMKSWGGTKKVMFENLEKEEALDICRDYGWKVDLGYVWDLEIEEE